VALSLACIVGLWLLKRWAAFVYGSVLICNQIVLMVMGYWSLSAAIIPAVIIVLMFKQLSKMSLFFDFIQVMEIDRCDRFPPMPI
jgi:hypothetical protein